MAKKELTEIEIAECIPDLWMPLTQEQREFLAKNFTVQKFKKNETIYCEGEKPQHLMCLLTGKVKIYKEGVGGRSQIIRVIKDKEYFAYRAFFCRRKLRYSSCCIRTRYHLLYPDEGDHGTFKGEQRIGIVLHPSALHRLGYSR